MRRIRPKHVLGAIAMICAAAVLMPVSVQAAGQLVTITDTANNARQAKVSSNGGLVVENRPGFTSSGRNANLTVPANGRALLFSLTGGAPKLVFSDFSAASTGAANTSITVTLEGYARTSGTGTCSTITTSQAGFSRVVFRSVRVAGGQTEHQAFPTTLIGTFGAPTGAPECYTASVVGGASALVGVSGYIFTP